MAVESDALSTTVFVLGVKDGLSLVNHLQGIDAIVIDGGGEVTLFGGFVEGGEVRQSKIAFGLVKPPLDEWRFLDSGSVEVHPTAAKILSGEDA